MSEPIHDPRGSVWRRWDLHFHTPSSYDIGDHSITNEQIVETLVNAGVEVVAITDHHFIDVDRIRRLQILGMGKLVVLPGLETPTELGGQKSVHVVAVFSEDCDLDETWKVLQVKHHLSPRHVKEIGDEAVFVDCANFCSTVHDLGGIVIAHAGTKSYGIEEIGNSTAYKQFLKTGLARDSIDVYEIANRNNVPVYRDIVFRKIDKDLPLVLCSDAHGIADYHPPTCWIKADPSFLGLRQVLQDPLGRVDLADEPMALSRVKQDATRYVVSVTYARAAESDLSEVWFDDVDLPLNPGLIAIIGNKGSGKSALAETLGLLGGCPQHDYFSFLHPKRFLKGRSPGASKAAHFEASIKWADESTVGLALSKSNEGLEERLKYIPQNYLETICNELQSAQGSEFRLQLEQVIMSHIPIHDRAGHETIESLIRYRTAELADAVTLARGHLGERNIEIETIEMQLLPEQREHLQQQLDQKKAEIKVLDDAVPPVVDPPAESPDADPILKAKAVVVEAMETEHRTLGEAIKKNAVQQAKEKQAIISGQKLKQAVANFQDGYRSLKTTWAKEFEHVGVPLDSVVKYNVDIEPLQKRIRAATEALAALEAEADAKKKGTLAFRHAAMANKLTELKQELSAPQRAYEEYKSRRAEWERRRADLIGDATVPGTHAYLEARIAQLEALPGQLLKLREAREDLVRELFSHLESWRDVYRELYRPVQDYIETHPVASDNMKLQFDTSITESGLAEAFFGIVRQDRKGSFCHGGYETLKGLVREADFSGADGVAAFVREVEACMHNDRRPDAGEPVRIEDQLKDGKTRRDLYDVVYSLKYLAPIYSLKWAGKDLDQLSPGEKGALLLVFYLLIDKDTKPLVIDQPEENLDNESVYEILVPCVGEARTRRQIILVTHNPNLAVVCDADQVIRADLDVETRCRLTYSSGAIEDPAINKHIVDVLEGTRPAFKKRDHKYSAAQPGWLQEVCPEDPAEV
jgi:ABC-type lipoprotein export system ATPase subunit